MPIELIKKTGKVDLTAYIPKGALPTGIDIGEFAINPTSPFGEYQIKHNLGVIPNVILIYRDDKYDNYTNGAIRAAIKLNVNVIYDVREDTSYPDAEIVRCFYDNASSIGQASGSTPDIDTDTYFYVPKCGTKIYMPADIYKWVAIAY